MLRVTTESMIHLKQCTSVVNYKTIFILSLSKTTCTYSQFLSKFGFLGNMNIIVNAIIQFTGNQLLINTTMSNVNFEFTGWVKIQTFKLNMSET